MDDDRGAPDGSDDADEGEPAGDAPDGHGGPEDGPAASERGPDDADAASECGPDDADGGGGPADDGETVNDDGGPTDDNGEADVDGDGTDVDGGPVEGGDAEDGDEDGSADDGDEDGDPVKDGSEDGGPVKEGSEDGSAEDGDEDGDAEDGGERTSQADIGLSTSHPQLEKVEGELAGTGSGTSDDAAPRGAAGDLEMYPYEAGSSPIEEDADTEVEAAFEREGPDEDREMPLTEHVEEMLKRLAVVLAVAGTVSLVTFPFAEGIINFLWNSILPAGEFTRPRLYGILELLFTKLRVASLAGLIIALPVLVYETYQFMRPGLYPHERRYYLAAIPTSLVLALVGVSFAYFVILPAIFTYFLYYSQDVATIGFALGRTFDLILLLMGYMAIVFQIPLFIMLAMMMGLVTRRWLVDRRLLFWGAFLGISFIFSPDPTGMAPIIVALTMIVLFEGTLALVKWTGRG